MKTKLFGVSEIYYPTVSVQNLQTTGLRPVVKTPSGCAKLDHFKMNNFYFMTINLKTV